MGKRLTSNGSGRTRRSFLAAAGVGTAVTIAGCFGGEGEDGSGYERISVSFSEQGSALNEGQLDVGVGTLMNFAITPSWLQEAIGSVDEFRVLDVNDETSDAWRDDDTLLIEDVDMTVLEGADNDDVDVPDEIPCPTFSYNFVSQAALDYDVVWTFLETMWDAQEELADRFGIFSFHEEPEFWIQNPYEGIPFHPAAADFYEEQGIWSDDLERADEPDETIDAETVRMKTSESGTTGHAANEALAAVMNEQLDDLTIEAQTSDGTEENIGDLADENIEMGYLQNWTAREFREDVEPYDQIDFEMVQVFHYYDLPWFFITDNMDLETLSDIESDMTISPTPSGSGTAPGLERALEHALDN